MSLNNNFTSDALVDIDRAARQYAIPVNVMKAVLLMESRGNWVANHQSIKALLNGKRIWPYVGLLEKDVEAAGFADRKDELDGNRLLQLQALASYLRTRHQQHGATSWPDTFKALYGRPSLFAHAPADTVIGFYNDLNAIDQKEKDKRRTWSWGLTPPLPANYPSLSPDYTQFRIATDLAAVRGDRIKELEAETSKLRAELTDSKSSRDKAVAENANLYRIIGDQRQAIEQARAALAR